MPIKKIPWVPSSCWRLYSVLVVIVNCFHLC